MPVLELVTFEKRKFGFTYFDTYLSVNLAIV